MILGLTGGIASGKSTVAKIFQEIGLEVIDADEVAKKIRDTPYCLKKIYEIFGDEVFISKEELNIEKFREKVFSNKNKLIALNKIIHPLVAQYFQNIKNSSQNKERVIIFDIPLLFESNLEYLCDKVLVIYTSYENQIKRVKARNGIDEELAKKIIDSQMSLDSKLKKADYIIENSSSLENLKREIEVLYKEIEKNLKI